MPLKQMPNGEWVDIAAGTSPEIEARIRAQFSKPVARVASNTAAPSRTKERYGAKEDEADIQRQLKRTKDRQNGPLGALVRGNRALDAFTGSFTDTATFGLPSVLASAAIAGTKGVGEAIANKDISRIGRRYNIQREVDRRQQSEVNSEHPYASLAGTIAGAFGSPVGAETGLGLVGSKLAAKVPTVGKVARAVGATPAVKLVARVGGSPIGTAARAGANNAALGAFINSDGDLNSAKDAYLAGGLTGGALGAAGTGAVGLARIVKDRAPGQASNVAYRKVAQMLRSARKDAVSPDGRPIIGPRYTPNSAVAEIKDVARTGGDPMLADISPQMQNLMGYVARSQTLDNANLAVKVAENRAQLIPDRFARKVEDTFGGTSDSLNAYERLKDIKSTRKNVGKLDYQEGGVMDDPIKWSDQLDEYMRNAPEFTKAALRDGYERMLNRRQDPSQMGNGETGSFDYIPNLRTFDYMKRAFDRHMGAAKRAGDMERMQELSGELTQLKKLLADSNPEYADILARQRDYYQQQNSVQLGLDFLKGVRNNPRKYLDDIKASGVNMEELRIGIADALLTMENKTGNPVAQLRALQRSKDQRAVLEHVIGKKKLNGFMKFMRQELRAAHTDKALARGQQSFTSNVAMAEHGLDADPAAQLGADILRGYGFGGGVGAGSAAVRFGDRMRRSMSDPAKDEIARILMGRGEGLNKGIANARAQNIRRIKANRDIQTYIGKLMGVGVGQGVKEN